MTSPELGKQAALELIQKYMNGEELKAPKLNVNKARSEYRMQYEFKKKNSVNQISSNITSNGTPVYASTTPFHSLTRVGIKDLHMHIPAKGSYLLLRTLELPILVVGIMLFVEDHLGRVIIVTLYNFIDYDSEESVEEILPVGTIFIIKEPLLKFAVSGQTVIRCDCPTDFIRITSYHPLHESVSKIRWKNSIDPKYVQKPITKTASELKEEGNNLYAKKKYFGALQLYLAALKMTTERELFITLQLNICAVYLTLEYFEDCLKYAGLVLQSQNDNIKALFRSGKAYYGLRKYDEALKKFQTLLQIDPAHKNAPAEEKRCVERLKEQSGNFDVYRLYLTSLLKPYTPIDFGDYIGPVNVSRIENKGRGIIASQNIKPGTFLVASKAFQAVFDANFVNNVAAVNINLDFTMDHGNKVKLLSQTCQAIMKNPNTFGHAVYNLSTNDPELDKSFKVFCDEERKQESISDADRLRKILTHNCFSLLPMKDQEHSFTCDKFTGSGFFIFPSYFNHSCVPNATWCSYNNVIVIRAIKYIPKGEEITISYTAGREDFIKKENKDKHRGFLCRCILCRLDRSEPRAIHQKRSALEHEHQSLCEEHYNDTVINPSTEVKLRMNKVIHGLEMTYAQRSALKVRLFDPYMRVAQGIVVSCKEDDDYPTRIVEIVDKALSALGLSCHMLLNSMRDENYSFPQEALLCEYSINQVLIFLVSRFQVIDNFALAQKWAKVLIRIHHIFTGGNVQMLRSKFKETLPDLYLLLNSM